MIDHLRLKSLMLFIIVLAFVPSIVMARIPVSLKAPPLGERWFGIYLNDERTGFAYVRIDEIPAGYRVYSESAVKMSGLGFSRQSTARETYIVNRDLSLRTLEVNQTLDGNHVKLSGEANDRGVRVMVESSGSRKEKFLAGKGPIIPPAVLNLYPLFHDVVTGKKYRVSMIDVEDMKVKEVRFAVVGFEKINGVEAVHLRSNQYPVVDNDIWIDLAGNTIKESVREGWIETRAEEEQAARRFLSTAALSRNEMILDFSLVKVESPVARMKELRRLVLELSRFPDNLSLLSGLVQKGERTGGDKVLITMDLSPLTDQGKVPVEDPPVPGRYLESSDGILSENTEIVRRKTEILNGVKDSRMAVEKLCCWVSGYLEETAADRKSPLETLQERTGNSLAHTRLYVSLARAAGIPTRIVSGIVYVDGKGFLYHSWAESYVGFWLPVDPVLGEAPANATHIKLVEGDSASDIAALGSAVGRIHARIVQQDY